MMCEKILAALIPSDGRCDADPIPALLRFCSRSATAGSFVIRSFSRECAAFTSSAVSVRSAQR